MIPLVDDGIGEVSPKRGLAQDCINCNEKHAVYEEGKPDDIAETGMLFICC